MTNLPGWFSPSDSAEPYYGPRRPHDELPLCLPSWSMQKCRIITFCKSGASCWLEPLGSAFKHIFTLLTPCAFPSATFGAFISIMLVPTFMMYWKHRQRIAALQTTLSVAQQNRREDALV
jgi:hypothetical protein